MSDEKKKKAKALPSIKSTVRGRKGGEKTNTQRYLPFAEIKKDTVILKNGGLRAVLQVEPLNFNLKSETEQQGIVSGYEQFINTLFFPVQILVHSTKVNIDPYIEHIHEKANLHQNTLMRDQALSYATFIEKIVEVADIMQKRFYIVVPLDDTVPDAKKKASSSFTQFFNWMSVDDTLAKALSRNRKLDGHLTRLKERVDLVEAGLHNIGLMTKQLNTLELIQLFYQIYNRNTSQAQKIPVDADLNAAKEVL